MALTDDIRRKVAAGELEFSQHALDKGIERRISLAEVLEAVGGGEIIEDYPDDKYGPSCLVLGLTSAGRALHVQCTYPSRPVLRIITLYEPDDVHWIDPRTRRR